MMFLTRGDYDHPRNMMKLSASRSTSRGIGIESRTTFVDGVNLTIKTTYLSNYSRAEHICGEITYVCKSASHSCEHDINAYTRIVKGRNSACHKGGPKIQTLTLT